MSKISEMMNLVPIIDRMNCQIIEENANRYVIEMPVEGNTNHLGTIYAGALFTLAEFPFGMMYLSRFDVEKMYPVVGDLSIRFVAPATSAVRVIVEVSDEQWTEMESETLSGGRYKLILPLELIDASGDVVAKTEATYFSIRR